MIKNIMQAFTRKDTTDSPSPIKDGDATYSCPMHPEVKSDSPGQCPKCGMFLEPTNNEVANKSTKESSEHDEPEQKHGCC